MSIALMNAAWSIDMPATRKMVLMALCDWSNDEGTSCHPSIKKIAQRASLSERQAQRVVHSLINDGWIEVIGHAQGGRPGATRQYKLNVEAIKTGDILSTGDNMARVTPVTETGDTDVTRSTKNLKAPPYSPPKGTQPPDEQDEQKTETEEALSKTQRAEKRLAEITADAIAGYNAVMAKPHGLLPAVNPGVGVERRRQQVKRCLRTVRQICQQEFGSPVVQPEFWEAYWTECDRDDFTSGRQPPGRGHENWTPSFDYLTREKVVLEVFEKAMSRATA